MSKKSNALALLVLYAFLIGLLHVMTSFMIQGLSRGLREKISE